jgi:hypothetical protein
MEHFVTLHAILNANRIAWLACWTARILVLLLPLISGKTAAAQTENVKDAINIIVTFCVAGGEKVEISRDDRNEGITLSKGSTETQFSRSEATGLVEGIRDGMNKITAGQASEARKCMQPYIDRILDVLLQRVGPSPHDSSLNIGRESGVIFIEWPPSRSPCRVNYHIDIADQRIVPEGPRWQVPNIRLGPTNWTIQGRVDCADGSFCESPGNLQSERRTASSGTLCLGRRGAANANLSC